MVIYGETQWIWCIFVQNRSDSTDCLIFNRHLKLFSTILSVNRSEFKWSCPYCASQPHKSMRPVSEWVSESKRFDVHLSDRNFSDSKRPITINKRIVPTWRMPTESQTTVCKHHSHTLVDESDRCPEKMGKETTNHHKRHRIQIATTHRDSNGKGDKRDGFVQLKKNLIFQ